MKINKMLLNRILPKPVKQLRIFFSYLSYQIKENKINTTKLVNNTGNSFPVLLEGNRGV